MSKDVRYIEEEVFKLVMRLSLLAIVFVLFLIIATIVVKGLPALSVNMITKAPKGGFYLGGGGGILNAILGSACLGGGATIIAMIIGTPVVLYINVFRRSGSKLAVFVRFSLDVLWGVPSIVYGAFGFTLMSVIGIKASLLGGMVTVSILMLPIMCRAIDEVVKMIPGELTDVSLALGATLSQTAGKIVLRQVAPSLVSATLIAFGRGVGDAASVLFTAGFTDSLPSSLFRPVATLPLAVFFQLGTPFPKVQERAYAAALVLMLMILLVSLGARVIKGKCSKHVVK